MNFLQTYNADENVEAMKLKNEPDNEKDNEEVRFAKSFIKTKNSGTNGTMTPYVYTNSADTLTSATVIATGSAIAATTRMIKGSRDIEKNGNNGVIISTSTAANSDGATSTSAQSTITLNNSSTLYIIFAVQNASTLDTTSIEKVRITEYS